MNRHIEGKASVKRSKHVGYRPKRSTRPKRTSQTTKSRRSSKSYYQVCQQDCESETQSRNSTKGLKMKENEGKGANREYFTDSLLNRRMKRLQGETKPKRKSKAGDNLKAVKRASNWGHGSKTEGSLLENQKRVAYSRNEPIEPEVKSGSLQSSIQASKQASFDSINGTRSFLNLISYTSQEKKSRLRKSEMFKDIRSFSVSAKNSVVSAIDNINYKELSDVLEESLVVFKKKTRANNVQTRHSQPKTRLRKAKRDCNKVSFNNDSIKTSDERSRQKISKKRDTLQGKVSKKKISKLDQSKRSNSETSRKSGSSAKSERSNSSGGYITFNSETQTVKIVSQESKHLLEQSIKSGISLSRLFSKSIASYREVSDEGYRSNSFLEYDSKNKIKKRGRKKLRGYHSMVNNVIFEESDDSCTPVPSKPLKKKPKMSVQCRRMGTQNTQTRHARIKSDVFLKGIEDSNFQERPNETSFEFEEMNQIRFFSKLEDNVPDQLQSPNPVHQASKQHFGTMTSSFFPDFQSGIDANSKKPEIRPSFLVNIPQLPFISESQRPKFGQKATTDSLLICSRTVSRPGETRQDNVKTKSNKDNLNLKRLESEKKEEEMIKKVEELKILFEQWNRKGKRKVWQSLLEFGKVRASQTKRFRKSTKKKSKLRKNAKGSKAWKQVSHKMTNSLQIPRLPKVANQKKLRSNVFTPKTSKLPDPTTNKKKLKSMTRSGDNSKNLRIGNKSLVDELKLNPSDRTDNRTKLMIRNIPNKFTITQLVDLFKSEFHSEFDFVYLVIDPKTDCNTGYGFINMKPGDAKYRFFQRFNNSSWPDSKSGKRCEVTYARYQKPETIDLNFLDKYMAEAHKYWVCPNRIHRKFPNSKTYFFQLEQRRAHLLNKQLYNREQYTFQGYPANFYRMPSQGFYYPPPQMNYVHFTNQIPDNFGSDVSKRPREQMRSSGARSRHSQAF